MGTEDYANGLGPSGSQSQTNEAVVDEVRHEELKAF
jgi:hypothetical protein